MTKNSDIEASTVTPAKIPEGEGEAAMPEGATLPGTTGAFDLAAWIEGVQPVTHAVTLYARGDLLADLDVVKSRLEQAKLGRDQATVDVLRGEAAELVDALEASSLDIVVQGWSKSKIDAFQAEQKTAGLVDDDLVIAQVAAQVIQPEGFTADYYRHLLEVIRPQAEQLAGAVMAANNRAPVIGLPL